MGDYRSFYEALKAVYGPSHQVQSPLRSSDGLDLLTDSTSILTRWSEHFQNLFSDNRTVQDTAMDRIPQLPLRDELDEIPSLEETIEAISQFKSRKAAGVDSIPPEIWKDGGPTLHIALHNLLVCCWEKGKLPQDFRDAVIITIFKNKGEKSGKSPYSPLLAKCLPGYRLDGSLFNLRRFQAQTKTNKRLIRDLLFADDAALVAHTEQALQRLTSCFADASRLFGLEISLKKTEVLHQPAPQEAYQPPHITINSSELKSTPQFTYLGCTISSDARLDKEIDNRLAMANSSFGRLYKRVWNNKSLKIKTKIQVYRAVVLTTLLYGSETWVTYISHIRLLERLHQRCLRTILQIHWSDLVTNVEVLEQAEIPSIEALIAKSQLRWAGQVFRMKDHRLPKKCPVW
ncbi:hypothetical protein PoB_001946900 [Plakobranchus ocellatus]|uniref:Reverse transcriptase domain-containing protein n=1 Tax=Plakobranchus ocellatus TaxID=259542 RepID=A0AAV3ZGD8_9GAST|nr:hypothetical protein PoB_001946900 [Plakobranchus ocellatus]